MWKVAIAVAVVGTAIGASLFWPGAPVPPRLSIAPAEIPADGYSIARVTIESETAPRLSATGPVVQVGPPRAIEEGKWEATVRSGVAPGAVKIRADSAEATLTLTPFLADRYGDGTPDALRLDTETDREAFRRWFTFLAEVQFFQDPSRRPAEINDCAALIRYAYRETLRKHDAGWVKEARLPLALGLEPVRKYEYPRTLLGPSLFRVTKGPFTASDLTAEAFSQFADAKTLHELNTTFVSRDLRRASPGDLLFFRHSSANMPYHTMIYLGASQVQADGERYLLYHTGSTGQDPGEMRRPTVEQLHAHPDPSWQPLAGNPAFLGVYRWNILR